jgi:hypothetical protein
MNDIGPSLIDEDEKEATKRTISNRFADSAQMKRDLAAMIEEVARVGW